MSLKTTWKIFVFNFELFRKLSINTYQRIKILRSCATVLWGKISYLMMPRFEDLFGVWEMLICIFAFGPVYCLILGMFLC